MNAAVDGWDMARRTIGECRSAARSIGSSVAGSGGGEHQRQVVFPCALRPDVTPAGLGRLGLTDVDSAHVRLMDSTDHIAEIQKVGPPTACSTWTSSGHFAGFLD